MLDKTDTVACSYIHTVGKVVNSVDTEYSNGRVTVTILHAVTWCCASSMLRDYTFMSREMLRGQHM